MRRLALHPRDNPYKIFLKLIPRKSSHSELTTALSANLSPTNLENSRRRLASCLIPH
jgi:hypothetical protein